LGEDFALVAKDNLYRCLDRLVAHKQELFGFLRRRWEDLFGVKFDVLLYDLTSTYFESSPPFPAGDKRHYGHSRDKRSDCVQVVTDLSLVRTNARRARASSIPPNRTAAGVRARSGRAQADPQLRP
jgi:hypothetical protein